MVSQYIHITIIRRFIMWNFIKMLINYFRKNKETEPEPVEPEQDSDSFLLSLKSKATLKTEQTPDITLCTFEFEGGDKIIFETRNVQEVWMNGSAKGIGFNVNVVFRHGILTELGDSNARQLGGDQLRLGAPAMPVIPENDIYFWTTINGKKIYVLNGVSVYAIRVVEAMKYKVGITSKMISANGVIKSYR